MSNLTTGTVKWFNDAKGFGFISGDNGNEVLLIILKLCQTVLKH